MLQAFYYGSLANMAPTVTESLGRPRGATRTAPRRVRLQQATFRREPPRLSHAARQVLRLHQSSSSRRVPAYSRSSLCSRSSRYSRNCASVCDFEVLLITFLKPAPLCPTPAHMLPLRSSVVAISNKRPLDGRGLDSDNHPESVHILYNCCTDYNYAHAWPFLQVRNLTPMRTDRVRLSASMTLQ